MKLNHQIDLFIQENCDLTYQKFLKKIVSSNYPILGVRAPFLKKYAKEITSDNPKWFYEETFDTYEKIALYGYSLGYLKCNFQDLLSEIEKFFPYIDNWAINDSTCSNLKQFKKQQIEGFSFIRKCLKEKNPYIIRFGLVLLLNYYINDQYIDIVLKICEHDYLDHYYVSMAHSWLISMCYIKYPNKTYSFLQETNINSWVYHKAISKICDSKRISNEVKEKLRKLR